MGDELDDAAPTGVAPTELGAAVDETEAVTAWSLDDGEDWEPPGRSWRIVMLAVAASVLVAAGAGVVAFLHLRTDSPTAAPTPSSTASSAPNAAPPPPIRVPPPPPTSAPPPPPPPATKTVTSTVAAPAPTTQQGGFTPEQIAPYDRRFVANLRALNWLIWDEALITRDGHRVCWELEKGATPWAIQQEMVNAGRSLAEAQTFVVTAMQTYPACP